ncbi:hypothetical protein ABZ752_13795 [Streptomyces roseifaciens]
MPIVLARFHDPHHAETVLVRAELPQRTAPAPRPTETARAQEGMPRARVRVSSMGRLGETGKRGAREYADYLMFEVAVGERRVPPHCGSAISEIDNATKEIDHLTSV